MNAIQFPTVRMLPDVDPSELAMHAIITASGDFAHALLQADSVSRVIQLRERLTASIAILTAVERAAFDKADALSEAKN